jgi:hypothetical protein
MNYQVSLFSNAEIEKSAGMDGQPISLVFPGNSAWFSNNYYI